MNKLFNFAQAKGKWYKFPSFNLGGGAKLYKNLAQKLLAVSLCMAMVLLGVPRGQNFVAEAAAEEATKSVALLTLTLTGDQDEPLKGEMEWKSFVPGTIVGLEVVFVDEEKTPSEPRDYGTWLATYGSMESDAAGFVPFAPPAWLSALADLDSAAAAVVDQLFGSSWEPAFAFPVYLSLCSSVCYMPAFGFSQLTPQPSDQPESTSVPLGVGLARLPVGASQELSFVYFDLFSAVEGTAASDCVFSAASSDPSVAAVDGRTLRAVGPGSATVTLTCSAVDPASGANIVFSDIVYRVEVYDAAPAPAPPVSVTGVTLSETTKTLPVGESFNLTATVTPENATDKTLVWSTSHDTIASVTPSADGLSARVTAVGAGDAGIVCSTADGTFRSTCEVTVTEAAGSEPDSPNPPPGPDAPDTPDFPAGITYLETTVNVKGQQQRIRVVDPESSILPVDTAFTAEYVDSAHGDHNFFIAHADPTQDVELQHFYNLTLTSGGKSLSQLVGPVEVWFEAIDGIDAADSFISRVTEGEDAILSPTLYTDEGGVRWIKVLTDHFSPYALTDLLSADEKAALTQENSGPKNNVKTGDLTTQIAVAGLGMVLVLALGIMLRLITSKKKFEE